MTHLHWIPLILLSAFALGLYDVCRKHAVNNNSVLPVLVLCTFVGTVAVVFVQILTGAITKSLAVSVDVWLLLLVKSAIVGASWVCAYYAMRALPITIASPIRGSQPVWTLIGAILLFKELPEPVQWAGIGAAITGYWLFSTVGRGEGIRFHANSGVFLIFGATILGALSGLYDKYLLQPRGLQPDLVQFWFQVNITVLLAIVWLSQRFAGLSRTCFTWRWTIPVTGLLLAVSDWLYFTALHQPDALISVLSPIRRSNAVISFIIGGALFKDVNKRKKSIALAFIITGVLLLCIPELMKR